MSQNSVQRLNYVFLTTFQYQHGEKINPLPDSNWLNQCVNELQKGL